MVLFGEAGQLFQWGVGSPPAASWHRDPTQRLLLVPFSAATSQPWGDVVPMPSQAICHPPVSIAWPSRRMSVLETERLSPSPPFSGEGAQSFIHSETRLINKVLLPARVLPLVSASLKQWENTFQESGCALSRSLSQHPWQAVWSKPTVRARQRRMELGPRHCRLAGWLSWEALSPCHQHTSC